MSSCWSSPLWDKLWGITLVVGATLRLWQLDAAAIWYDERLQVWVSTLPLRQMLLAVGADVHPPLHYLITWALVHLGLDTAWWLRLPSVLAGLAAIVITRQLAERWDLSPMAGWLAGVLVAVLPMQLNYSQEARSYTLLQLLYLLALLALTGRPRWPMFSASIGLLLYCHNYGFIYAATLAPLAAARLWGDAEQVTPRTLLAWAGRLAAVFGPAALAYLPWAGQLAGQLSEQAVGWWKTPATAGQVLYVYFFLWWHSALVGWFAAAGALTTFALAALSVVQVVRTRLRPGWVLVYLAAAPVLAALLIEQLYRPILLHRAMIGAAVPLYLLAAHALDTLRPGRLPALGLSTLLLVAAAAHHPMRVQQNAGQVFAGSPDLYRYIVEHAAPGDVVVHGNVATLVDTWGKLPQRQVLMPIQPGSKGVPSERFWAQLGVEIADPASLPAPRLWVLWSAGPTIAAAEDAAVRELTRDAETIWSGHTELADAGLWLLTPNLSSR